MPARCTTEQLVLACQKGRCSRLDGGRYRTTGHSLDSLENKTTYELGALARAAHVAHHLPVREKTDEPTRDYVIRQILEAQAEVASQRLSIDEDQKDLDGSRFFWFRRDKSLTILLRRESGSRHPLWSLDWARPRVGMSPGGIASGTKGNGARPALVVVPHSLSTAKERQMQDDCSPGDRLVWDAAQQHVGAAKTEGGATCYL